MFRSMIKISLLVIFCLINHQIQAVRNRPIKFVKRATQILNRRYSNPEKQQKKLIQELKNNAGNQSLNSKNLSIVVTALTYANTIAPIARNKHMLEYSTDLFHDVPGYPELVERIIKHTLPENDANLRGALFELQKAIEIEQSDSDEYVEAFNKQIRDNKSNRVVREIDIVTNKRWIECKAGTRGKKLGMYKAQIADQQELAFAHNQTAKSPIVYEVHFKSPVAEVFLEWLEDKGIAYSCPKKLNEPILG